MASAFTDNNNVYASKFDKGHLPLPPANKLAVVTCMDARIDPAASLGINLGEAHVIRNAGGRAPDAVRSLVISQRLLGTREIAVFHHTDCGMLTFKSEELHDIIKKDASPEAVKAADAIGDFLAFPKIDENVKEDVEFLKGHPLILEGTKISGWVYHVETGKVSQVV
ncbi:carbonic anhydrase [Cylindrobasidium torrendii FP15055 ss-10]|uniref:Carbonic anhydrase n=1 Tax=Cylindrobasidium torrendii FP15055 ss-10 TaxID=1314674 RepID=A0A0D7BKV0_9AGAR|nr:carbonic anhydrase [Cylindrobasidium torrendii FP15055 ss-10]